MKRCDLELQPLGQIGLESQGLASLRAEGPRGPCWYYEVSLDNPRVAQVSMLLVGLTSHDVSRLTLKI